MRSFFAPHLRRPCAKIRRRPETLLPDVAGISRFESEGSLAMPLGVIILEGAQRLIDYGAAGDDVWQENSWFAGERHVTLAVSSQQAPSWVPAART